MYFKKIQTTIVLYSFLSVNIAYTKTATKSSATKVVSADDYNLNTLALPSEVKNVGKSSGSIFYSPSVKGKILIPINIWGEVRKSGLHFLPLDTTLTEGLSFAGGPTNSANLEKVKLSRRNQGSILNEQFDFSDGGSDEAALKKLKPGDTIFVQKSNHLEDRAYYTSLIGVVATILSSILLYRQVKN